jgi:ribonuclease P protein component
MLPRQHRLIKRKDFEKIWEKGKSYFIKEIGFKVLKRDQTDQSKSASMDSRFAFIVSAKTVKKAVLRNKIKRRLREIIRKKLPEIKSGFDCIIIIRPGIEKLNYQEMKERVEKILTRLSLL